MKDIFDKILFAVLASLLSTYVLYSYNVYSKAFDAGQAQAHSYSALAGKVYSLAVGDTFKAVQGAKSNFLSGARPLDEKSVNELERVADELQLTASVFSTAASEAPSEIELNFKEAKEIALSLAKQLREKSLFFQTRQNLTAQNVSDFVSQTRDLQTKFVKSYNRSIGSMIALETSAFEVSFDQNIPWQAKPANMLYLSFLGILIYLAYVVGFARSKSGDFDIT